MNYDRRDLRDRLASEYVLGTLHGRARRRFQRLLKHDPTLLDSVEQWEQKLVPMAASLSVPAPSIAVWNEIAARIVPAPREVAAPGWFERWSGWRSMGPLAAGLVIGVGSAMLVQTLFEATPQHVAQVEERQLPQSYVGFLQDEKGNATVLVSSLRHGKIMDVKILRTIVVPPGAVLQLWALPQAAAPFPVGVVPAQGKGRLTLVDTSEQLFAKVTELAVSVEPREAPPGSSPSGPFVLRGPCTKLW